MPQDLGPAYGGRATTVRYASHEWMRLQGAVFRNFSLPSSWFFQLDESSYPLLLFFFQLASASLLAYTTQLHEPPSPYLLPCPPLSKTYPSSSDSSLTLPLYVLRSWVAMSRRARMHCTVHIYTYLPRSQAKTCSLQFADARSAYREGALALRSRSGKAGLWRELCKGFG